MVHHPLNSTAYLSMKAALLLQTMEVLLKFCEPGKRNSKTVRAFVSAPGNSEPQFDALIVCPTSAYSEQSTKPLYAEYGIEKLAQRMATASHRVPA